MKELFLASQSPRRRELLESAGLRFHTLTVEISEFIEENLTLEDALIRLAVRKSEAALKTTKLLKLKDFLLLTADTVVVLNQEVLGKPRDRSQAVEFLSKLSGNAHRVMTAFSLLDSKTGRRLSEVCTTVVEFRELGGHEIQEYVESGEPMDKAGAYAIQGAASTFVKKIEGPHDNVVGLPVGRLIEILETEGWLGDLRAPLR